MTTPGTESSYLHPSQSFKHSAAVFCSQRENRHGHEDCKGNSQDKRGKIPLLVYVCEEENFRDKMEPEAIGLESLLAGTEFEAPGQSRLPSREMQ